MKRPSAERLKDSLTDAIMDAIIDVMDELMDMSPEDRYRRVFRSEEDRIMRAVGLWPHKDRIERVGLSMAEWMETLRRITKPPN
jgi:hypothetical protein